MDTDSAADALYTFPGRRKDAAAGPAAGAAGEPGYFSSANPSANGNANGNHHRRGTGTSLFSSDATLVDHMHLVTPSRVPSNNTEASNYSSLSKTDSNCDSQTLSSLMIEEEGSTPTPRDANTYTNSDAETDTQNLHSSAFRIETSAPVRNYHSVPNTATASSASSISSGGPLSETASLASNTSGDHATINLSSSQSSNRGILKRSSLHGLGHRSSKSESFNFNLKLPRKSADQKSLTQLNQLQEHEEEEGTHSNKDNNNDTNTNININSKLQSRMKPSPNLNPNPNPNPRSRMPSLPTSSTATPNNTQALAQNKNPLSLSLSNSPATSKNGFFNLPSAPVDSQHNFTFLNNPSPQSSEFNFTNFRKLNSPLTSSFKLPNSSLDALPSRSTNKARSNRLKIPEKVKLLKLEEAEAFVTRMNASIGQDGLTNLLIIDVRPFHDYCKKHMSHAINVCLPSTLLKRSTFSLEKCIQTLTSREKILFEKYSMRDSQDLPTVLFYDDFSSSVDSISPSIYHLAGKFLQNSLWNSELFILEGGFSKFVGTMQTMMADAFNERRSSSSSTPLPMSMPLPAQNQTQTQTQIQPPLSSANTPNRLKPPNNVMLNVDQDFSSLSLSSNPFSPSTTMISPQSIISPENFADTNTTNTTLGGGKLNKPFALDSKSPIGLSRFILPDVSHIPVFKTRNYDEMLTNRPDNTIHLKSQLNESQISKLPKWLTNVIGNDLGSSKLTAKFNDLQLQERKRLDNALKKRPSNESNELSTFENPIISSGVELGRKNRYKDIFLFEHSRVKLNNNDGDEENTQNNDPSNYVNASYIHYDKSELSYIATQGPLEETVGDFWKVIYDNDVPIIFSLTPQCENQVEKCAPYWIPGTFQSNGIPIIVEMVEFVEDLPLSKGGTKCVVRRFFVKVGDSTKIKEVLQIHMLSWPDFGIVICEEDILSMISIKRYIYNQLQIQNLPAVVHCSAGCGRTGSFCVIDTCIDVLFNNESGLVDLKDMIDVNGEVNEDLIYDITSVFRSQRVFMVQTLRQYMLIYDSIIKFLQMHWKLQSFENLNKDGLVDWSERDPGIFKNFVEAYK